MNKMQNLLSKINWKSKKTIAVIVVIVIILLALLVTSIVLAVEHRRAESLPAAVPGTTAEMAADDADVTMPAEENTTSENTTVSGGTDSGTTSKPSGGSSSGSGTTSKPSGGSGSGTASKPSGGGSSGSDTTSKPSTGGGSTSKPETTTSKPETTQPAKKEFAMTKDEIIAYASKYIEDTYHSTYLAEFNKNNAGYNAPPTVSVGDSADRIKRRLREAADATYGPNGWYKVYVEQIDENTMRVYMFYS